MGSRGFSLREATANIAQSSPVAATIEKGFLPTALLEETGIIGVAIVLTLLASILLAPVGHERLDR